MSSCEDVLFQSERTYQIRATVNNVALDIYSIVKYDDLIQFSVINDTVDDQDLYSINIFMQNNGGVTVEDSQIWYLKKNAPAQLQQDQTQTSEQTITVDSFYTSLPPLIIPDHVAVGYYDLVFQLFSKQHLISQIKKPVMFIGKEHFSVSSPRIYRPDVSSTFQIIPAGTTILLEVLPEYDSQFDPYVIWFSGTERIKEGFISKGANTVLWKAPNQETFQQLQVEVFPFFPVSQTMHGIVHVLKIPISPKVNNPGYFFEYFKSMYSWYHFRGDLNDSLSDRVFGSEQTPRFVPAGDVYGLAIGPQDRYSVSSPRFKAIAGKTVRGTIALRVKALSDGTVFTSLFEGTDGVLEVTVAIQKGKTVLIAQKDLLELPTDYTVLERFVTMILFFEITDNAVTVYLKTDSLDTGPLQLLIPKEKYAEKNALEFGGASAILDEVVITIEPETLDS
jgi:hypothetical protein